MAGMDAGMDDNKLFHMRIYHLCNGMFGNWLWWNGRLYARMDDGCMVLEMRWSKKDNFK